MIVMLIILNCQKTSLSKLSDGHYRPLLYCNDLEAKNVKLLFYKYGFQLGHTFHIILYYCVRFEQSIETIEIT